MTLWFPLWGVCDGFISLVHLFLDNKYYGSFPFRFISLWFAFVWRTSPSGHISFYGMAEVGVRGAAKSLQECRSGW